MTATAPMSVFPRALVEDDSLSGAEILVIAEVAAVQSQHDVGAGP